MDYDQIIKDAQEILQKMQELKEKHGLQSLTLQSGQGVIGIDAGDTERNCYMGKYGDGEYSIYEEEKGRLDDCWDLTA